MAPAASLWMGPVNGQHGAGTLRGREMRAQRAGTTRRGTWAVRRVIQALTLAFPSTPIGRAAGGGEGSFPPAGYVQASVSSLHVPEQHRSAVLGMHGSPSGAQQKLSLPTVLQ